MKLSPDRVALLMASCHTALSAIVCHGQTNITLPPPIPGAFQDFEAVDEGALPAGWSVINYTTESNPDLNLDDPNSASYEDWVVISRERMIAIGAAGGWDANRRLNVAPGQVVNGAPVTALMIGKFIYAESDVRSGSQVQYLFSPDFNCTGQVGVTLVFYSGYEQNQDNIGAVEYSVDEGLSWLPVAYLLDGAAPPAGDIIRDEITGNIDAEMTMNNSYGDVATYTDDEGNFLGGTYGSFIAAPIAPELAPFIQGRVNDNSLESKRVEVYRLAQADNKPKVRLRFAQAGTTSWYWGLDNIGLYAIPPHNPPNRPTISAPATADFFADSVTLTGSAFAASDPGQVHGLSVWQVAADGVAFSADTGLASPLFQVSTSTGLISFPLGLERFFPGQILQVSVRYQDQFSNKSQFAAPQSITVGTTFPPLVPGTFEDFEGAAEFDVPAGWSPENQTDEGLPYPGWFVATDATLGGFGGDRLSRPEVVSGNTLYAESDTQNGNLIAYITTPEYNLAGYSQVWVAFKSNYEQNQDSFGGLEFSTNDGQTWQPIVYMIDEGDIARLPNGNADALTTLTTPQDDVAKIFTEDGVTRVDIGKYEDFLLARPVDGLGPFISPRLNDDAVESKRYQRYRIAGADNQARVKFRFAHTGTGSWYWGIDDFGLYSASPSTPVTDFRITSVRRFIPGNVGPASVELKWTSVAGKKYTVQSSVDLATWPALATDIAATGAETTYTQSDIPAGDLFRYYRVREQP